MNKIAADLHMHTFFSDGILSPKEIVEIAISKKLEAIAISDHDSIDSYFEAKKYSDNKIEIIPAIEFSAELDGKDIHILGYYLDPTDKIITSEIEKYCNTRKNRAQMIVDNLNLAGVDIDFSDVARSAGKGAIGRPHIAREMIKKNIVRNSEEAFINYLGDNSPYYVPKHKITPAHAFKIIKDAGGIPVWAHPGKSDCIQFFDDFIKDGLMGIEVFHPGHSPDLVDKYLDITSDYNLLVTGGTDFHGSFSGPQIGDIGIDSIYLKKLQDAGKQ